MHSSSASTVKYSGAADPEYSADFEEYSFEEDSYSDKESYINDEVDDLSDPTGIYNYLSSRIGEEKVVRLFDMIQARIDNEEYDEDFRLMAREIIGEENSEETEQIIALAEAALFLQNAFISLE